MITIGKGITYVDPKAFYYCDNIKKVYCYLSEENWRTICTTKNNNDYSVVNYNYRLLNYNSLYYYYEVSEKAPTCLNDGNNDYSFWSHAGSREYIIEPVIIPALGHDLIHHDSQASTCKEHGWNAYDTCSRCDYTTYEELPLKEHTPADAVEENVIFASCTAEGSYESVIYCSVCSEEISRETVITEPLGHTPSEAVSERERVEPTCTNPAGYNSVVYCSVCGEKIESQHITFEFLPHTDSDGDGLCDICKTVTDSEKHNLQLAKNTKINVPQSRTVRYKYKVSMTATADLPDGYYIQWYSDGSPVGEKGNKKAVYVTEPLTAQKYLFNAVVVDSEGQPVTPVDSNSVTVTVNSSFISRLISVFARIFGLNIVNLNE